MEKYAKQKLNSELRSLYESSERFPHTFRVCITMTDPVDGDVRLIYSGRMEGMDFMDQATCFRGMVSLQSDPDIVLDEVREYLEFIRKAEVLPTIGERQAFCRSAMEERSESFSATVSYAGKSDFGEAGRYVREFGVFPSAALPSVETPINVELSALNGFFYVNFIQRFRETCYFDEFLRELQDNSIGYDVLRTGRACVPGVGFSL